MDFTWYITDGPKYRKRGDEGDWPLEGWEEGGGYILREILTHFHRFCLHLVCSLKFLLTFLVPISIMVRATQNILFLLQLTEIEMHHVSFSSLFFSPCHSEPSIHLLSQYQFACLLLLSRLHSPKLLLIISHLRSKLPPTPGCHSHVPFPWSQYQISIIFANCLVRAISIILNTFCFPFYKPHIYLTAPFQLVKLVFAHSSAGFALVQRIVPVTFFLIISVC